MDVRRVVEYLVVSGIVERKDSEVSISSTTGGYIGSVLQSFPHVGKRNVNLPEGIELFCQPQGWDIVSKPQSPYFIPFVLTSETGARLYCMSLNFYQPHRHNAMEFDNISQIELEDSIQHRALSVTKSVLSTVSVLSGDIDVNWEMTDGGRMGSPRIEYEPISLCAISVQPLFDILKHCLCGLYASWVSGHHDLEELAAKILTEVNLPVSGSTIMSLGSLKEMKLPSYDERTSLPLTTTECIVLLKSIGVHKLITLLTAILMDESILFISSSYSSLTGAVRALVSLVYPFVLPYSLVPIVPQEILDYVQLPSTYIMGVPSMYAHQLPDSLEVIQVFLDEGRIQVPPRTEVLPLPPDIHDNLETALHRIIDPRYGYRDAAFPPQINEQLPSVEYQDKQVRAVFLCAVLSLVGDYYKHITIVKLHPEPAFAFNKKSFLAAHTKHEDTVITQMANSLVFQNFIQEKAIPYRMCDYADDLMAELVHEDGIDITRLFSTNFLRKVTDTIADLLLCDKMEVLDTATLYDVNEEALNSQNVGKPFPTLDGDKIDRLCKASIDDDEEEEECIDTLDLYRLTPIIPKLKESHSRSMKHYSNIVVKDMETLQACLDALFENKIYEARKFIPVITLSFKNEIVAKLFVPKLVTKLNEYGGFLGQEQFDILVKLINSAMLDDSMAARLLPLSTAFYRELCPGTTQQAYSYMQNHLIWENKQFWRETMYNAIQTELVRIHTEKDDEQKEFMEQPQDFRRRLTNLSEEEAEKDIYKNYEEEVHSPPAVSSTAAVTKKSAFRTKSDSSISDPQPIRSRAKPHHSASQQRLRVTQRMSLLSRSVRMRMRASIVIPGAAEGVALPDAEPVTIHEAMEVLGEQQRLSQLWSADKQQEMIQHEENAIFNQVVLFVSRVIWLRCPLDYPEGENFMDNFGKELQKFLLELLRSIEVDIRLDAKLFSKIKEMIEGLVSVHFEYLRNQRKSLQRLPDSTRKIIKPPLLAGEELVGDCVRTYLLPDGRDTSGTGLLPAEGYFFVTSYRLIFLGTPCDPNQPNTVVTRAMPLTALYQLKKTGPQVLPRHGINIVEGLQMRSVTGQLIKIGFDEEMGSNAKKIHEVIVTRKHPRKVVLALAYDDSKEEALPTNTGHLKRCLSDTQKFNSLLQQSPHMRRKQHSILRKSRVVHHKAQTLSKSNSFTNEEDAVSLQSILKQLSHTPVCREYMRMGVGDITKEQDKSDQSVWRLSTVNAQYSVCNSYPAVVAVPASVSDDVVISLTSQFKENRFPVATWRHPTSKAVILRSAEFCMTNAVTYHKAQMTNNDESTIKGIPPGLPPAKVAPRQTSVVNLGGNGIYHVSMEKLLLGIVLCVKNLQSSRSYSLSETELLNTGEFQEYNSNESNSSSPIPAKKKITATKSTGAEKTPAQSRDSPDWERGGYSTDEPDGPTFSRETHTSPDPLADNQPPRKLPLRKQDSRGSGVMSPTNFSSLPTTPRDWVTVEALPREMSHWKTSPIYIIADKGILRKVPPTLYDCCTLLPVEERKYIDIQLSFKKLMRACSPSSPGSSGFLGAVEDSEWLNQLSNLLQLAGAIVDLIDLQNSSVLVALEKGWDYTAQVVSLAQLLLDPYYRTIKGFKTLVEKDWVSFGHPFSSRNNLTTDSVSGDFSPVFLQFLDCVHQIHRQFPVSFEFNDFFLRMMAYHYCSMRFHTFSLNTEKERTERGWQDYHVTWTHLKGGLPGDFNSFWMFIDEVHKEGMMFYNFNYSSHLSKDVAVLRPYSFVANLDVWSYYLENPISQLTPYDPEFISHRPLTLSDIHHKFFNGPKTVESTIPVGSPFTPLIHLVNQCIEVTNEIHIIKSLPKVSWLELLNHFEMTIQNGTTSEDLIDGPSGVYLPVSLPLAHNRSPMTKRHNKVLHSKTSMAVLIKGRLSVETERNFIHPHCFVPVEVTKKKECHFCKHRLQHKAAFRCTACEAWCHNYCRNLVPYNCGVKDFMESLVEDEKPEEVYRRRTGSSMFYVDRRSNKICEGYLYKKGKMVKNWKLRWFILDLETKELSYYDNQEDSKSKGTIDMTEVITIQAQMTPGFPVPVLKADEKGFFFQLITQKRTFQFMSVGEAARHEWMSKLKQCAGL